MCIDEMSLPLSIIPASRLPDASLAYMVEDTKAMALFHWSSSICRDSLSGIFLNSCTMPFLPSVSLNARMSKLKYPDRGLWSQRLRPCFTAPTSSGLTALAAFFFLHFSVLVNDKSENRSWLNLHALEEGCQKWDEIVSTLQQQLP